MNPVLNVAMPLETKPAVTNHLNDVFAVGSSAGLNPNACGFATQRASVVEGCQRTAVSRSNDEYLKVKCHEKYQMLFFDFFA